MTNNALAVYERMSDLTTAARALHTSGFFQDVKSEAQAMVKVLAGAEMGLPPFAAMSGIHIVQGKPVIGANLIATMVKNSGRYDYRVKRADNEAAVIAWYESGQQTGESSFTMAEAQAAGLAGKDNWKKYPSDMLFARALTRGARRYAPGIFGGAPIYTPDELNVDTDEDGHIVQGEVINVTPPAPAPVKPANSPTPAPAVAPDSGPLPDDEQVIAEAGPRRFLDVAAATLGTDPDTVKGRLKALGYSGIPGDAPRRLDAYRRLRDDVGATDATLFATDDDDARQAALATAQGRND